MPSFSMIAGDPAAAEQPHQVVFERDVKARTTGVALARATSAQLPVDAPRFMAFAANHVQAAHLGARRRRV